MRSRVVIPGAMGQVTITSLLKAGDEGKVDAVCIPSSWAFYNTVKAARKRV